MKNLFKYLLTALLICTLMFAFASCGEPDPCDEHTDKDDDKICDVCKAKIEDKTDPDTSKDIPSLKDITFGGAEYFYDGEEHSLAITDILPDGITVEYEGNGKSAVGSHTVTAKFYYEGEHVEGADLTATLRIKPLTEIDLSDVIMSDKTVEYDGEKHSLAILGYLPEGVTVKYTGNGKTNASETPYEVVAKFYYKDIYIEGKDLTAEMKINRKDLTTEMYSVYFTGKTVGYNGEAHSLSIIGNLPKGVTVDYIGNGVSEVGEHTVTARFTVDETNYVPIADKTAKIKITPAEISIAGLSFSDKTVTYDGNAHSILLVGDIPEGVTVNYDGNGKTNAGEYTVTASFTVGANYKPIADMTAELIINPAPIDVTVSGAEALFDGKVHSPTVSWAGGVANDDIIVTVKNAGSTPCLPGTYTFVYSFTPKAGLEGNYIAKEDIEVTVVIVNNPGYVTEGLSFTEWGAGWAVSGVAGNPVAVVIPETYQGESVISVKTEAFMGLDSLEYVYLPRSIVNIGNRSFDGCTSLSVVRWGELTVIGQHAFRNTALVELVLPDSLTSIGIGAFEGTEPQRATLPFIGGSAGTSNRFLGYIFGATAYAANSLKVPESLTEITVSGACLEIPEFAFYGLTSLNTVVIESGVERIGNSAFAGCWMLKEIYIPKSVTRLAANAEPKNSPFYETHNDMLVVVEDVASASGWGRYFAAISDYSNAIVVYNKTYEEYLKNKDSYRTADPADATLSGIFLGDTVVEGFNPATLNYTVDTPISVGYPTVSVIASVSAATVKIEQASSANGGVATVTVTSMNGENTKVYKVSFNVTGTFESTAQIVNKNGAEGAVSFVIDDGYHPTATWVKSKLQEYAKLTVSFAVKTEKFATLTTTAPTDSDGYAVGVTEYVMDGDKYTYTVNQEEVDFWRDILALGRSEVVSHSHTHKYWGATDLGGSQISSNGAALGIANYPVGSIKKEVYASMQIVKDLFGDIGSEGITFVTPGVGTTKLSNHVISKDLTVRLYKAIATLAEDVEVTKGSGTRWITAAPVDVDLQSVVVTIPAGSVIRTALTDFGTTIPKGTLINIADETVTVPAGTTIKADDLYDAYDAAEADGIMIGSRLTGQVIYTASSFTNPDNRDKLKAYMITSSTNELSVVDKWKAHIDNAMKAGGYATFCIHAITDSYDSEGEGGHKITKAQADALFKYAEELGDRIWVATQTDAMKYFFEWSSATVSTGYENGTITVSLTDNERDDLFDMPLTVKVSVPGTWASVSVGGKTLEVKRADDGTAYVYVDVAPETSVQIVEAK